MTEPCGAPTRDLQTCRRPSRHAGEHAPDRHPFWAFAWISVKLFLVTFAILWALGQVQWQSDIPPVVEPRPGLYDDWPAGPEG